MFTQHLSQWDCTKRQHPGWEKAGRATEAMVGWDETTSGDACAPYADLARRIRAYQETNDDLHKVVCGGYTHLASVRQCSGHKVETSELSAIPGQRNKRQRWRRSDAVAHNSGGDT
jgi:hypothetical protein